ncbi:MAG: hypothetical protein RIS85_1153 [Pseudomonadota bacterium]|jgi:hypothetical protein
MSQNNSHLPEYGNQRSLRATLMLLAFGLSVLGFLVAIGHPEWFELRPVSTAAAAMSEAADKEAGA